MVIMESHQLVILCRSETDAFESLFQKKKEQIGNSCPHCKDSNFISWTRAESNALDAKMDYNPFLDTSFSRLRIGYVTCFLLIELF